MSRTLHTPFLAADVGGTHARVALVRDAGDGSIELLDQHKYAGADFPGLAAIIKDFLAKPGMPQVHEAAIGCAAVCRDDKVVSANLPWPVSLAELRALGIPQPAIVNDFVAVAHAVQCMTAEHSALIGSSHSGEPDPGPTLVFGPGTGLGAALRVPYRDGTVVLPSEAGHPSFAPGNAREIAVLEQMLARTPHVNNEQIVSGPGLLKLYNALCAIDGATPVQHAPADVVDAAQSGADPHATEALQVFCAAMGSVLADVVIVTGATSVFIAGGIVPKIRDTLDASNFHARFLNKGVMRPVLERVPIRLIENPHKGVIGTATWYLQRARGS